MRYKLTDTELIVTTYIDRRWCELFPQPNPWRECEKALQLADVMPAGQWFVGFPKSRKIITRIKIIPKSQGQQSMFL